VKIQYPVLFITDVHSNLNNLKQLLAKYPTFTVVCLGDVVNLWDRNLSNQNQKIIEFFMDRRFICVRGNHDEHVGASWEAYGITQEMSTYLNNLPVSVSLELPDNKRYDCFHYRPNDYWGKHDFKNLSYEQFCNVYTDSGDANAVLIGHMHEAQELRFPHKKVRLICVGALMQKQYAILTDNGVVTHLSLQ
jgi:predicted phosphodiesterase